MARKKRKRKSAVKVTQTLCISCIHAYGDDCFGFPFEERYWVKKAEQKKCKDKEGTYEARIILDCVWYKKEEDRRGKEHEEGSFKSKD